MAPYFPNHASFLHPDNGMTELDMVACSAVARRRDEIIMFRSTGPWSRRWIERGHPTKPFHVKGKSSDWGPQAGFVPRLGTYSKVGADPIQAAKGDAENAKGIHEGFARRLPLVLTEEQLAVQREQEEERPGRRAVLSAVPAAQLLPASLQPHAKDLLLKGERPASGGFPAQPFSFLARWNDPAFTGNSRHRDAYTVYVFPEFQEVKDGALRPVRPGDLADARELCKHVGRVELFEVMGTAELSADGRGIDLPLTGDYDLFAIGPSFNAYAPSGKDRRYHFFQDNWDWKRREKYYRERVEALARDPSSAAAHARLRDAMAAWGAQAAEAREDPHRGNVTPRLLEVLDELNGEMAVLRARHGLRPGHSFEAEFEAALAAPAPAQEPTWARLLRAHFLARRVHHNEEAGRPFFAPADPAKDRERVNADKLLDDACPITVFQPRPFARPYDFLVGTLQDAAEIRAYYLAAHAEGYVLPKNTNWVMDSALKAKMARFER